MKNTEKNNKNYIIKVTDDLLLLQKRVDYSWKKLYGAYKISLSEKHARITLEQKSPDKIAVIPFETKNYGPRIVRNLFNPKSEVTTKSIGFWTFLDKPRLEPLDVVANALRITNNNYNNDMSEEEYRKVVRKLKRKLYKHKKRQRNTKIVTSNTPFGNLIKIIDFGLNRGKKIKKISRSRRKKLNKNKRIYASLKKECKRQNLIKELYGEDKSKLTPELQKLLDLERKHQKEALKYLERLKIYEKACKDTDVNPLDLLFSAFDNIT